MTRRNAKRQLDTRIHISADVYEHHPVFAGQEIDGSLDAHFD
jgi:hypothetical protein